MKPCPRWAALGAAAITAAVLLLSSTGSAALARPLEAGHPAAAQQPAAPIPPAVGANVFVPITPCRILDTRTGTGGHQPLRNDDRRDFFAEGTSFFERQGGTPGGCGIPDRIDALAITFTAITPSAAGFIRAWPTNQPEPNATVLNFQAHTNISAGTTVGVQVLGGGASLEIEDHGGTIDLTADVFGYYLAPIQALISPAAYVYAGTVRVGLVTKVFTGQYQVSIDTDVTFCSPTATPYSTSADQIYADARTNGDVNVRLWQVVDGTDEPYDGFFYLTVTC